MKLGLSDYRAFVVARFPGREGNGRDIMKRLAMLAAVAALAACSEGADEPMAAETTAAAPEPVATEQGVAPGTYEVEDADGAMGTTVITSDGGYIDTDSEGTETRGAYVRRDGQDCFDPAGDDPEMCWTVSEAAADGSFTATSSDGTTVTVRPQPMAEEALEPAG